MKEREQQGQSDRLRAMLELRFDSQGEAASALGCWQSDISRYVNRFNSKPLPAYFFRVYAPKLEECGLNPDYLTNPSAPMLLPQYASERAAQLESELQQLKQVAHV